MEQHSGVVAFIINLSVSSGPIYQAPTLPRTIDRKRSRILANKCEIIMSQAKTQGVSFHPSQLTGKATSLNPGNEWKDFTEDDDDLDENQVCTTAQRYGVC